MGLKLLCVVAHPDDECFAFGGALALAAEEGIEVRVVCFTDGKAASYRGAATSGAELGAMRRAEFAASCEVLGIAHHEVLDYEDGQLEFASFSTAAGLIVQRIRDWKPDVVVTFGGDGAVNTHADHTMVSAFATAAFHWAGRAKRYPEIGEPFQAARLFYLSANFFLPGRQQPMPMPWTVTLDVRGYQKRRQRAFEQHTTQAPLMESTRAVFDEHGKQEYYVLAAEAEPHPATQTTSFFEGLTGGA